MAAEQGEHGRTMSKVFAWLAVPRPITLLIILAICGGCGQLLWFYVDDIKVMAWLSGMAAPFCVACATTVWVMRDKLDEALDVNSMNSHQYQKLMELSKKQRFRSIKLSACTMIAASLASSPAVSEQLAGFVYQWSVILAFCAVGFSMYAYMFAEQWDRQIQDKKRNDLLALKKLQEMDELSQSLESSATKIDHKTTGWNEGPELHLS